MDRPYGLAIEFIYDRHSWVSPRIRSGARYHATGSRRRGSRGPLCRRRDLVVEFRRQRAARGRADRAAGRPGDRRNGGCTRRSGAPARHRDGPGLQHGRPSRAGSTARSSGSISPRARRSKQGDLLFRDRSATLPDGTRPGAGRQGEGRGAARQRPGSISSAIQSCSARGFQTRQSYDQQTALVGQLLGRDQGRSGADRQRRGSISTTPRSARRSTAASAPAWSTSATSCIRSTTRRWSRSPS